MNTIVQDKKRYTLLHTHVNGVDPYSFHYEGETYPCIRAVIKAFCVPFLPWKGESVEIVEADKGIIITESSDKLEKLDCDCNHDEW